MIVSDHTLHIANLNALFDYFIICFKATCDRLNNKVMKTMHRIDRSFMSRTFWIIELNFCHFKKFL